MDIYNERKSKDCVNVCWDSHRKDEGKEEELLSVGDEERNTVMRERQLEGEDWKDKI